MKSDPLDDKTTPDGGGSIHGTVESMAHSLKSAMSPMALNNNGDTDTDGANSNMSMTNLALGDTDPLDTIVERGKTKSLVGEMETLEIVAPMKTSEAN